MYHDISKVTVLVVPFEAVYNFHGVPKDESAKAAYLKLLDDFDLDFSESRARYDVITKLSKLVLERHLTLVFLTAEDNVILRNMQKSFVEKHFSYLFNNVIACESSKYTAKLNDIYCSGPVDYKWEVGVIVPDSSYHAKLDGYEFQSFDIDEIQSI